MTNSRQFNPVPRSLPGRHRLFLALLAALALTGHSMGTESFAAPSRGISPADRAAALDARPTLRLAANADSGKAKNPSAATGWERRWNDLNQRQQALCEREEFGRALAVSKEALKLAEQNGGPNHFKVGASLNNLAHIYNKRDRYAQAEPLLERALVIIGQNLGPDAMDAAVTLNNLAFAHEKQGRYAQAETLYRRSLAIYEKSEPDGRMMADQLYNLASLYRDRGQYAQAEPLFERSLAINEKALGPSHLNVAMDLKNLGLVYSAQGRYAQAEASYRRALSILEQAQGRNHPNAIDVRNKLAALSSDRAGVDQVFHTPPTSSGAWRDVPASERGRVLGEMKAGATAEHGAALDRLSDLRAQELPFYPDAILYEGRIENGSGFYDRFAFIRHPQGFTVLTGESGPIYALNASAPLRLDTEPRVKAYLRFFCAALETNEGDTFTVVERPDELPWKAGIGAAVRRDAERKLKPLMLHRGDGDLWLAEGTILYRNMLYDIKFEIAPDGQATMLSDQQQSAELPVQSPRFAEVVRRARQSDHSQPSGSDHHERTRL